MQPSLARKLALGTLFFASLLTAPNIGAQVDTTQGQAVIRRLIPEIARNRTANFARTQLLFGTAMPGGVVTEGDFKAFLDEHVTPRFPDGLTVINGDGQFRGADGMLVKEDSSCCSCCTPWRAPATAIERSSGFDGSTWRSFNRSRCSASTIQWACGFHSKYVCAMLPIRRCLMR